MAANYNLITAAIPGDSGRSAVPQITHTPHLVCYFSSATNFSLSLRPLFANCFFRNAPNLLPNSGPGTARCLESSAASRMAALVELDWGPGGRYHDAANFTGLVLGCIETEFCK